MTNKMLEEFRRRRGEQRETLGVFNKELENIKKKQTELKNTIADTKNKREGVNRRLDNTEEQVS